MSTIEKNLNVRISLKYDTLANWMDPANQFKLNAGEMACVEVANNSSDPNVQSAPTVLFKIGDGEHTFNELNWASAKAADVYAWAKLENPTLDQMPSNLKAAINRKGFVFDFHAGEYYDGDYGSSTTTRFSDTVNIINEIWNIYKNSIGITNQAVILPTIYFNWSGGTY